MNQLHVSLDQWRMLLAIVDAGGFAQAARALHRSQSSVSYAMKTLQAQLGIEVFRIDGRKARLTTAGESLVRRARRIVAEAVDAEAAARQLAQGWEPEIRLLVDAAFPLPWLIAVLERFLPDCRGSRVQLGELVMSGIDEALVEGRADVAVTATVPPGFVGERLLEIDFVAVAGRSHPLAAADRLRLDDLRRERQIVIRDSGVRLKRDVGWLGADQRFTVTQLSTAVTLVAAGLGFAWLPRHMVAAGLTDGSLVALPLASAGVRREPFHLVVARGDDAGPAAHALAAMLREVVAERLT
jgi:DNA-binding transcriptional LysR family regulator